MSQINLAAIDLGTNSCRLMITDSNGHIVFRKTIPTKLGEGLHSTGKFTDRAIKRGINCLSYYADMLEKYKVVDYRAIATASCRMAKNGTDFIKNVKKICNIDLEVIDAREEALLNLKGAQLNAAPNAEYILVYDLGGGSTEITLASNTKTPEIIYTVSIPWGARNASEAFNLAEYSPENAILLKKEIQKYTTDFLHNSKFEIYRDKCDFLATSSTPLRLVSMANKTKSYNRQDVDGQTESILKFDEQITQIKKMNHNQMAESKYIGKNRAAIFQAACIIFKTIYDELQIPKLTASLKGAQEAIINELVKKWQS